MDNFYVEGNVEDYSRRLESLQALARSPGWAVYESMLLGACQGALTAMKASKDDHMLAKVSGAYFALSDVRTWLDRELEAISNTIKDLQNVPK